MMNYLRIFIAWLSMMCGGAPAFANFSISPSGATTLFAVDAANQGTSLCAAASTECAASVPINTAGTPLFTAALPAQVSLANTGANTNKLLVTPDSVALPANQSVNAAQINGVTPLMGNGVTGTGSPRVTIASDNTAFSVNANAGTNLNTSALATSANLTAGTMKTQIVDGSGNVIASTSNNLDVQCANCSGSGVSTADEATFTGGSSLFAGSGGFFQTTATNNALTTGQQGMFQVTANRALFSNLRNAAGTEVGTAGAPLQVSVANTGANGTQIAVSANVAQVNGVTTLTGTGAVGTGTQRVAVGTDTATIAGSAPGTAGTASANVLTVQGIASMTKLLVTPDSVALPANQSVNVAQFGGTSTSTGQVAVNTAPVTATNTALVVDLRPDSPGIITLGTAVKANSVPVTFATDQYLDPCMNPLIAKSSAAINITTATTTSLVAVSGSTTVYVCGVSMTVSEVITTPNTILFEYGTGAACTSPTVLTGKYGDGGVTAGIPIVVNASNGGTIFKSAASNGICALTAIGASASFQGVITYVQS